MNKMKNCSECGKIYVDNGSGMGMCHACYLKEEEYEQVVASFVRDHPGTSVQEIHAETGVKEKIIYRMIRSGRFVSNTEIFYPCESCGAPISRGRLCDKCSTNILKQVAENEKNKPSVQDHKGDSRGMYTNRHP